MRVPRTAWGTAGKVAATVGIALAGIASLVVLLCFCGLLFLRSDTGKAAMLRLVLPRIQTQLGGTLRVGRIEGNLSETLILDDLALSDGEGQPALRARRIALRYRLKDLLGEHHRLDELRGEGVWCRMRVQAGGSFNLATLTKAGPPSPPSPPGTPPTEVEIAHIYADGVVRYELGSDGDAGALAPAYEATVARAEGRIRVGSDFRLDVARLEAGFAAPFDGATLRVQGGITVDGSAVGFREVLVDIGTDEPLMRRLLPRGLPEGPLSLHVEADGPPSAVSMTLRGVTAGLASTDATRHAATTGRIEIDSALDLVGGRYTLSRLLVDAPGLRLRAAAAGSVDFHGNVDATVDASDGDLALLSGIGTTGGSGAGAVSPELGGRVAAHAHLRRGGGVLRVDGKLHGEALRVAGTRIARLTAKVTAPAVLGAADPVAGEAHVEVMGIDAGALRVDTVRLDASGDHGMVKLSAVADGPHGTELRLRLHAATRAPSTGAGADAFAATVDELRIGREGKLWRTTAPAVLRLGATLGVASLKLASGTQRVQLDGHYRRADGAVAVALIASGLDAAELEPLYAGARAPRLPRTRLDVQLRARASTRGPITVDVEHLEVQSAAPYAATLAADGQLVLGGKSGGAGDGGGLALNHLRVDATAAPSTMRRLLPGSAPVAAQGPWRAHLLAEGPSRAVRVALDLRPPRGTATLAALLDLDPLAADVKALVIEDVGLRATVAGRVDARGNGAATLDLAAADLSRLADFGAPAMRGRMTANVQLRRADGVIHLAGHARGDELVVGESRVASLDLDVATQDLDGHARLLAHGLRVGALSLDTVTLDAAGDTRALTVALDGRGPRGAAIALRVHGAPRYRRRPGQRDQLVGVSATVDELRLALEDKQWRSTGPATIEVDGGVALRGFHLASGAQTLSLDGSYPFSGGPLDLRLAARAIDAAELQPLLLPGKVIPKTNIDIDLVGRGTAEAPIIDLDLHCISFPDELDRLLELELVLRAGYLAHRAKGELIATLAGQKLEAHLDVPVDAPGLRLRDAPIDGNLSLELLLDPNLAELLLPVLADLMPSSMQAVQGHVSAKAKLWGTLAAPELDGHLHVGTWGLSPLKGGLDVDLGYHRALVTGAVKVELSTMPAGNGADAGKVTAKLALPLDLAEDRRRARSDGGAGQPRTLVERLAQAEKSAGAVASLLVERLDLAQVPFARLGLLVPLSAGVVDGGAEIHGAPGGPVLHAELRGRDLAGPRYDRADARLVLDARDLHAVLDGALSLRGAPLVRLVGQAALAEPGLLHVAAWKRAVLSLHATVPGYPLSLLPELADQLDGVLSGEASFAGSIDEPDLRARLAIAGLRLGAVTLGAFTSDGEFDGRTVTLRLDAGASASGSGSLHLDASVPLSAEQPWKVALRSDELHLDLRSRGLPGVRTLTGRLNADLALDGSRAHPTARGTLRLDDAELALAISPIPYRKLHLDLSLSPALVTLRDLAFSVGEGSLRAHGDLRLDGLTPTGAGAHAEARRFPLNVDGIGALIDLDGELSAERAGDELRAVVEIKNGSARLPRIDHARLVQSTGPLEDVRYVDREGARAVAAQAAAVLAAQRGGSTRLVVRVVDRFQLHSPEASTALAGQLEIGLGSASAGGSATVKGRLATVGGWLELMGRRYQIDRARVLFDGAEKTDPELDVRIARALGDATIFGEVTGRASRPSVYFGAEPPLYSQPEVAAMILSGDSGAAHGEMGTDRPLDSQVVGALSGIFVGQIKSRLPLRVPIDVLKVDVARDDFGGGQETSLEAGTYLTESLYVSYLHQFSTLSGGRRLNENQAEIDYRLVPNLALEAMFGDAAIGGLDLYWTHRF